MVTISADVTDEGLRISIDTPHGYDEVTISWLVLREKVCTLPPRERVETPKPKKIRKTTK